MDEEKLKAILSGSIEDAKGKLSPLSAEDLKALHKLEEKGQKRSGMLEAIDREAATRSASAGGGADQDSGNAQGGGEPLFTQAQLDEAVATARSGLFDQAQVDAMLAQQAQSLEAETARRVAEANGATAPTITVEESMPLTIDPRAEAPGLVATTGATQIVFVDDHDHPVAGLSPMTFGPADFEPVGDAVALKIEVDFPKELPTSDIAGAFLIDDEGDAVGKATLVMPFGIGGGRTAKLAKSTLHFAR